ncbi:MAG: hypothetical protein EXR71_09205 [Myxococcales bacterium]|nr:hypothetical protein [Myxococcales bacterium]
MKPILFIAKRELGGYLTGPIGWICLVVFTLIAALFFNLTLWGYASQAMQLGMEDGVTEQMVQGFFGNLTVIGLLLVPAVTMGSIAQDRRERSVELLLTSPISSLQIALGKYFGAFGFVMLMIATTAYVPGMLYWMGDPDWGVMLSCYAGFTVLMGVFVAVGLFASSMTDNQLVALASSFSLSLSMWIVGWLGGILKEGSLSTIVTHISMLSHFETMSRGVLHLNDAVYFISVILFFIFATTQRVEALRWR